MHLVKCFYCEQTFDRDIEKYSLVRANRYAHANCMLQKAEEDPKCEKREIIDPSTTVLCCKCKKSLNKMSSDCVCIVEGKYICSDCENKENKREKTDQEKLDDYIMQLFKTEYVDPKIKKQIKKYIEEYNFSYSGIHKALYYFYNIKGNPIEKANGGIAIVPWIYSDAFNYYYALWEAQQRNKEKNISEYIPKEKEIKVKRPERKIKKSSLFNFLEEEEDNEQ